VTLPRMLIGTNWFLGYSHRSPAQDNQILSKFDDLNQYLPIFGTYLKHGIDAVLGPISERPALVQAIENAKQKFGKDIIIIDTPLVNMDDSAAGRKAAEETFKQSAKVGSSFCLIHHSCAEQLVNKNLRAMPRLPDYLSMIRQNGMIPGLSAHMPELITYSDANEYDVQTYIQIYNCLGFLMQIEIETVARTINNAKKPVMTIKPFAAGRVTPYVGLNFVWSTIRDCDMVTAGVFSDEEAAENIEISFAHFEHRYPNIQRRRSPNIHQAAFGDK